MQFAARVYLMPDQKTVEVFQATKKIDSAGYVNGIHKKTASVEDTHEIGRVVCAALKGKLSEC